MKNKEFQKITKNSTIILGKKLLSIPSSPSQLTNSSSFLGISTEKRKQTSNLKGSKKVDKVSENYSKFNFLIKSFSDSINQTSGLNSKQDIKIYEGMNNTLLSKRANKKHGNSNSSKKSKDLNDSRRESEKPMQESLIANNNALPLVLNFFERISLDNLKRKSKEENKIRTENKFSKNKNLHCDNVTKKLYYEDAQRRQISYRESNNLNLKLHLYKKNNRNKISNNNK